jgi:hypothetical protein
MTPPRDNFSAKAEAFIARWQGQEGGQERANYALFLTELCDVLDLPHPDVAKATHAHNDYVFERAVQRRLANGDAAGRIDLYKRNSFVLEAKQSRWKGGGKEITGQNDLFAAEDEQQDRGRRGASRAWDVLMLNAKRIRPRAASVAWLAAVHSRMRRRSLHRGLCGFFRTGKELHPIPRPAGLSHLP